MRSFIAVELNPSVIQRLSQIQEELKLSGADVKWVKPENIHLTLKFLGEQKEEKIEEIKKTLEELVKNYSPFKIVISQIGCFPKLEYPRVIWVGVENYETLERITLDLEERLSRISIAKEKRKFTAHITLGRVRSAHQRRELVGKLKGISMGNLSSQINCITLFKSTLTPRGPIYEKILKATLTT